MSQKKIELKEGMTLEAKAKSMGNKFIPLFEDLEVVESIVDDIHSIAKEIWDSWERKRKTNQSV